MLILIGAALGTTPAMAGSAGAFAGTWIVTGGVTALWADPKNPMPDNGERAAIVGHAITIGAKAITGPRQVACTDPHYAIKTYTTDMLFQGTLKNPSKDAPALGFKGKTVKTLETGCEIEIDWHMNDAGHLEFGLNDYIYMLTKK